MVITSDQADPVAVDLDNTRFCPGLTGVNKDRSPLCSGSAVGDDQELRFLINNQISKTFEDTGRSACISTDLINYLKSKELS